MDSLALELMVIVALTLVNAFFSGSEIAILAVRKTRLRELADEGDAGARMALRLRDESERFLATVQIGITVVGATAGAFGGAVLEGPMSGLLRGLGTPPAVAESVAFALVVAFVSVVSVVLGELVPKSLALRHSETVARWVSRPLYLLSRIARPAVWFLTASSNVILRPFRDQTNFSETHLSTDELRQMLGEAAAAGTVDRDTGHIAARAIDLGALRAFSVMVPRAEITWLAVDASADVVERTLRTSPHARYPVRDEAHQPLGYVVAHELFTSLLDGRLDLKALLREIPTFAETETAVAILRSLQSARTEIGIVVDDTGFPSGLVSIESLAEELFGEIVGEREAPKLSIAPAGPGVFDVRGDTALHDLNRELGTSLPVAQDAATLAGLVLVTHGGLAPVGTRLSLGRGVEAEVLEATARRIVRVRLYVAAARAEA